MRHLTSITKGAAPARAAVWQDITCTVAFFLEDLLGSFGGQSPLLVFIGDKCHIPDPEDD